MPLGRPTHTISSSVPMIIGISASAIVLITVVAIAAWLVRDIAEKALDKTPPDSVAPVVLALGALLDALHRFLPWSKSGDRAWLSNANGHYVLRAPGRDNWSGQREEQGGAS